MLRTPFSVVLSLDLRLTRRLAWSLGEDRADSLPLMAAITRINRLRFVNAYLVAEDDGLTVIDTMIGGSAARILAGAEALGAPVARIALLRAPTISAPSTLAEAVPDAEVIISVRDARLLAKDMSLDPGEPDDKLRGGYPGAGRSPIARSRRAIASARSRWSPPPATHRATWRCSTRVIAPFTAATPARRSAGSRRRPR